MPVIRSLRSPLAAAALCAAAAQQAAAQQAAAPLDVRPAVQPAAFTVGAPLRSVARYRLVDRRRIGLPSEVTVADSAGTLVASYRLAGFGPERPMVVAAIEDDDLLLQAETPSGVLTIQLFGQYEAEPGTFSGHWWLGEQEGDLRGYTSR